MKIKNASVQVKAGPDDGLDEGKFTAYASVFGNVDSYGDRVMPGAFAKALTDWAAKDAVIPLLFGHRMDDPDFNIGHVVEAVEDAKGLRVTAQLDLENPKAAQTYRLLKGKRIDQMSFAYDVIDGRQKDDAYELHELSIYEVSVVPIGANQETEVLAVKAATDALLSGTQAGREIPAKSEAELRRAHEAIGNILAAIDGDGSETEKASGETEAKSDASDEAIGAVGDTGNSSGPHLRHDGKSSAPDEEPKSSPSARLLAAHNHLILEGI